MDVAQVVRGAWEGVLGSKAWAPDDDFFDSGGTSLQAAVLMANLSRSTGRRMRLHLLLRNSTLGSLTGAVENALRKAEGVAPSEARR